MGIQWVTGEVTAVKTPTAKSNVIATILGDNGKEYSLKPNGFAPEDRAHSVKIGQRVKFEDRLGYVMDLRDITPARIG